MKIVPPEGDSLMNARRPNANCRMTVGMGRPFLSTYARNFGAMPLRAKACRVRVEAKVQEFATLMTEMVITALKTEGRPLTPALVMAMTKGESFVFEFEAPRRRGSFEGTIKPRMNRLTT